MSRVLKATRTPQVGTVDRVTQVREFLAENYEIRINEFDTSKSEIRSKEKEYLQPISFQDIYLHLVENGINVGMNILKMILTSPNYSVTYNPIFEYLESLKGKYRGVSQIDQLSEHITARYFGDMGKEPEYFEERKGYLIKKWIVATAACALGYRQNDVALGLVASREGIGKTYFFEFLVPDSLKEYYRSSEKDDRLFDITTEFTRNFVVHFDELLGVTASRADVFKKVLSAHRLAVKRPREEFVQNVPRIASASFTSNRTSELGGFLSMDMGLRRYGIIDVESINKSYSRKVDVEQLWAEAMMLLEQDFDFVWNDVDFADFDVFNARYIHQSSSHTLMRLYYEIPVNEEDGEWMNASDILMELKKYKKVVSSMGNVNEVTLGLALKGLGFYKKGIRDKEKNMVLYKYLVKSKLEKE